MLIKTDTPVSFFVRSIAIVFVLLAIFPNYLQNFTQIPRSFWNIVGLGLLFLSENLKKSENFPPFRANNILSLYSFFVVIRYAFGVAILFISADIVFEVGKISVKAETWQIFTVYVILVVYSSAYGFGERWSYSKMNAIPDQRR